ncbi:phenylacetate--CoA ligase family protein [Thomasclavelia sp.]
MNYLNLLYKLYQSQKNIKRSRNDILKLQEKKLRNILEYSFHHSAYYHRVFEAVGITNENIKDIPISSFPTLDKTTFIQYFDEIVTDSSLHQNDLLHFDEDVASNQTVYKHKYHVVHSSGSTGKPTYYVYDEHAWNEMLIGILRAALWDMSMTEILKLLLSGPRIVYIAATDGRYGGAMAVGAGIEGIHAKQLFLDINLPVKEWMKEVEEFQPNIIIGYPSAIKILAEFIEKKEVNIHVTRAISCGEPLNSHLRDYLEKIIDAPIINIYGASESLAIGVETSSKEGMYLFDDMNYVEIENGNMYLTSLYNFTQPLIRYKISDRLIFKETNESQYPLTLIENILGRNEDMMWFEDENGEKDFLHPLAIEGFVFNGMLDFQFHQIDKQTFKVLIQMDDQSQCNSVKDYMQIQMKKILAAKNLSFVRFVIQFVDEIYPDKKTGKKRLITKEPIYE